MALRSNALDKHVKALFCTGLNPIDGEPAQTFFNLLLYFLIFLSKENSQLQFLLVVKGKNGIWSRCINLVNTIAMARI